jgi:hypothetical protein
MNRKEVYELIDGERAYQDIVWHRKENNDPNPLTIGEFVLMLEQYAFQARAEWTLEPKPEQNTMEIIRKIGAIAVNAMEQHGARPRQLPEQPKC